MRKIMTLFVTVLLALIVTAPPSSPTLPEQGTEGPSIRKVEPKGTEGPDVRLVRQLKG